MKTINEPFEDKEYNDLRRIKRKLGLTWKKFILLLKGYPWDKCKEDKKCK